jgi:hypothetical protein
MLLDGYCKLNMEGFNKILKKYDKVFGTSTRAHYIKVDSCNINQFVNCSIDKDQSTSIHQTFDDESVNRRN